MGSWLAYHEFELSTTKDPPCREAMHVKSVESSTLSRCCLGEDRIMHSIQWRNGYSYVFEFDSSRIVAYRESGYRSGILRHILVGIQRLP
ncbi:hypothetical protein TNCV_4607741 [Trichonephila clavipes]|nr:hypothetical protein TNCV_4607741 [Trichonephila clavipes]